MQPKEVTKWKELREQWLRSTEIHDTLSITYLRSGVMTECAFPPSMNSCKFDTTLFAAGDGFIGLKGSESAIRRFDVLGLRTFRHVKNVDPFAIVPEPIWYLPTGHRGSFWLLYLLNLGWRYDQAESICCANKYVWVDSIRIAREKAWKGEIEFFDTDGAAILRLDSEKWTCEIDDIFQVSVDAIDWILDEVYTNQSDSVCTKVHFVASLLEPASSGRYGKIYRGRDTLDRDVAVKILKHTVSKGRTVDRQGKALAKVNHPNVVMAHAVGNVKNWDGSDVVNGLVMEWIEGADIDQCYSTLTADQAIHIAHKILDGLDAIHAKKLVHRDLHGGNIRLRANTLEPVILDLDVTNDGNDSAVSPEEWSKQVAVDVEMTKQILSDLLEQHGYTIEAALKSEDSIDGIRGVLKQL